MKTLFITTLCASSLFMLNAQASTTWVALEGGVDSAMHATHTNTAVMPDVDLPDAYVLNHLQNTWMLGFGAGYEFSRTNKLFPQLDKKWLPSDRLGIFYDYYAPQQLSGVINKYLTDPAYTDHVSIHSHTFWLDNQLDLAQINAFTPFLDLGIGVSRNSMTNYAETPTIDNVSPRENSAAFADKNTWAVAYRAGLGVNYHPANQPIDIGILYRYTNRGRAKTGDSANYPIGALSSNHLTSNQIALVLRSYF
jgi:opacity protein-like surface antigen